MKKVSVSYPRLAVGLVSCLVCGVLLSGCASMDDGTAVTQETDVVVRHAIYGEELQKSMQELKRLSSLSSIARMYSDSEVDLNTAETAQTAKKIEETAKLIPAAIDEIEISEQNKAEFMALVDQLSKNAALLSEQASANDIDSAKETLKAMNQTCTDCHSLYRTN
jgi:cytochrome c556